MKILRVLIVFTFLPFLQAQSGSAPTVSQAEEFMKQAEARLAELNVKVHVTQLAKWKTTLQMIALGVLLAGPAGDQIMPGLTSTGLVLLWVSALLTLWTGFDYLKAAVRAAMHR